MALNVNREAVPWGKGAPEGRQLEENQEGAKPSQAAERFAVYQLKGGCHLRGSHKQGVKRHFSLGLVMALQVFFIY